MAIKLNREKWKPCEYCETHTEKRKAIESCAGWSRPIESAYEDIQAIPAADVAPVVHGKWKNVPANGVYDTICTNCGFHLGIRFYPSEYCPNCGAKMDKEGT